MPKKVMLLHNPTAGASHPNAEALLESIHKAIGVKPSYFSIKNGDWKDALSKRWDAVILAGGDGTVGKSVRRLRDRKNSNRDTTSWHCQQHCSVTRHRGRS